MAIIRSRGFARDSVVGIANPGVEQALRSWEDKVLAAREEGYAAGMRDAEAMLADAEQKREQAQQMQEQVAAAIQQGIQQGLAALAQEQGRALAALQALVARDEELRRASLEESEHACVALACALAGRILHHAVSHDPTWMNDLLADALHLVPERRQVTLRMHPEDAKLAREHLDELEQRAGLLAHIVLEADGRMQRGDAQLESAGTNIDASIGGSWTRLRQHLLERAPDATHQIDVHTDAEQAGAACDRAQTESQESDPGAQADREASRTEESDTDESEPESDDV